MGAVAFLSVFLLSFLSGQVKLENKEPAFNKITKSSFISGTPEDSPSLLIYKCNQFTLEIEYAEQQHPGAYYAYFIINRRIYHIKELLVPEQMDFYNVSYLNKSYLLVSSQDGSASGKACELFNYYLFSLNEQNKVVRFNSAVNRKFVKKYMFLKLMNKLK